MADQPHCPSCQAPVSARATRCVLCDTALTPMAVPSGAMEQIDYRTGELPLLAPELKDLFGELSKALAPGIRLTRILGEGGMGIVFLGHEQSLRRDVAIKVLAPRLADDPVARARFTREAEASAAVTHPNVVAVHQVGELLASRTPYFVMQYVEGPTLDDATGRMLPELRVRRIMAEVASALAAAHQRKVVHRDIKPGNVVLDGETGRAIVLDFGISAALNVRRPSRQFRLTTEGMYVGTPTYMSPEQASGEDATPKSDVYALGVLAFELLTGRPPFLGNPLQMMAAHVKDPVPNMREIRSDVNEELVQLVERCLAKRPDDRPSAADVVRFLQPASSPAITWPPPGLAPLRRASERLAELVGALGASMLAFFTVLALQPRVVAPAMTRRMSIPGWDDARLFGARALVAPDGVASAQGVGGVGGAWVLLLGGCAAVLAVCALLLPARAWRVGQLARHGRNSGYPWRVIGDAASDLDGRWREVVNATGPFAFVDEKTRGHLLHLRRVRAACVGIGGVASVVAPLLWLAGWIGGWSSSTGGVLPASEYLLVVAPACLALLAFAIVDIPEWRVRRRALPARVDGRRGSNPAIAADVVRGWLSVEGSQPIESRTRIPLRPIATLLGALAVLAGIVSLITMTVVAGSTLRLTARRAFSAEWLASLQGMAPEAAWSSIDDGLGALALPPTNDTAAVRDFTSLTSGTTADVTVLAARVRNAVAAPSLTDAEHAALARDTVAPSLSVWRRFAHVQPLPPLWLYPHDFGGTVNPEELDVFGLRRVQARALANLAAGRLALERGDAVTAELRARENLAVARQLTRVGTLLDHLVGSVVARDALPLLRAAADRRGDAALSSRAERLSVALGATRAFRPRVATDLAAIFAAPGDTSMRRLFADRRLPPAQRLEMLQAPLWGSCLSSREVLFGADPRRMQSLPTFAAAMTDVPRAREAAALWQRSFEVLIRQVVADERRGPQRILRAIGLGGLADRWTVCRAVAG